MCNLCNLFTLKQQRWRSLHAFKQWGDRFETNELNRLLSSSAKYPRLRKRLIVDKKRPGRRYLIEHSSGYSKFKRNI